MLGCHSHWVNNKPPTCIVACRRGVTRSLALAKLHENDTEVSGDDTDEPNENDFAGGFLVKERTLTCVSFGVLLCQPTCAPGGSPRRGNHCGG